jgi:DNA-binding PadR family transcriptional regulator
MKSFNFPHEHPDHQGNNNQRDFRRGPRARRNNDATPPTGEGEFTDPRGGFPGFPGREGRGGHHGPRGGRGFGPRGGGGPGFGPRGGGRVRKGNVRSAILSLLSQHSYNGYGMIGAIAAHTDGAWRPSPGSIYPALAALQSEGLIESTGTSKRTEFELTETGKAYVAENAQEMAQVWAEVNEEAGAATDLRLGMGKLVGAVQQIGMAGTEDQIKAATEALDTARRAIYKLLAD